MQPDSIIPDQTNPQSWNRYSYVENDPVNYSDVSGHFKCKNDSETFKGDCQAYVELFLTLLQEAGGEEGQALVDAFRNGDTVACRGRGACSPLKDQFTITIVEGGGGAGYSGDKNIILSAALLNSSTQKDRLVQAAQFGHEIVHYQQEGFIDQLIYRRFSSSLYREIEAYEVEAEILYNMGLSSADSGTVQYVNEVASYGDQSPEQILESRWARNNYPDKPLNFGGSRGIDNYLWTGTFQPLPLGYFRGI